MTGRLELRGNVWRDLWFWNGLDRCVILSMNREGGGGGGGGGEYGSELHVRGSI